MGKETSAWWIKDATNDNNHKIPLLVLSVIKYTLKNIQKLLKIK